MSWGSFSASSLEREYQAELGTEKVRLTRILTMLGIALTLAFMALDLWAIPSALLTVWAIRGLIITGLALAFLSTCLRHFQRWYTSVIVGAAFVMGAGVNAMIYVGQSAEVAVITYHSGLVLIIMGLYTLTYLNLYVSTAIALVLTASYTAIEVLRHGHHQGEELVVLFGHLFLFVSTTVIGIAAQVLRDTYSRENYLLRHSLQRDVEIKEEEKRHASHLAEHDPLTGVPNRLRFDKDVNDMFERAAKTGSCVQVLFLDMDGFKPVNDEHGHAVGDRVLREIAQRLRRCLGPGDLLARVGGDEFVVALAAPVEDAGAATRMAETIAIAVGVPIDLRGTTLRLSVSIGLAGYPMDGNDLEEVMRAADAQMYVAKNSGTAIAATPGCQARRLTG